MGAKHGGGGPNPVGRRDSKAFQLRPGLFVGVAVLISLVIPQSAFATEAVNTYSMTVLVFNFRQVPSEVLGKAENEVGRIFQRAGIRVTWQDCPTGNEPCQKGPGYVVLLGIMAGPVQNPMLDTISGRADPADHLASVYYDYLPRLPGGNPSDKATVLACVTAHELGHLLLGRHGHSVTGIMRESWDVEQARHALMSQLSFLPEESEILRATLRDATQPRRGTASALMSSR